MKIKKLLLPLCILSVVFLAHSFLNNANEEQAAHSSYPKTDIDQAKVVNRKLYEHPTDQRISELSIPDSLEGLEFANVFHTDENKNLVASNAIKDLFDSYLSTLNKSDLETVITLIQAEINQALTEPARSEAIDLLKRYIDYKIALVDFESSFALANSKQLSELERIQMAQSDLKNVRQAFFNATEYERFFSEEEAQNNFMLEQLRINSDASLSDAQKTALIQEAEQRLLPAEILASRQRLESHVNLRTQVDIIRQEGGSEEDVFLAREQALGSEAAIAMQELDNEREQWDERLRVFANERNQVLDANLSEEDKANSVQALIAQHFEPFEHKRVSAIMNAGMLN